MNNRILWIAVIFCWAQLADAQVKHVILISIDGFHPDMYLDPAISGTGASWPTPNLQQLLKQGTYADHLFSVFPAYTHPAHAAMETGALPARSDGRPSWIRSGHSGYVDGVYSVRCRD